jgi:hypothetical protein
MDHGTDGKPAAERRGLLKALGLATGAAALAQPAAGFEPSGGTAGLPPRKEGEAEKRKSRYRETEHVKAFYRTNGF